MGLRRAFGRVAVTAAARCTHDHAVTGFQVEIIELALVRCLEILAIGVKFMVGGRARSTALESIGAAMRTIAEEGKIGLTLTEVERRLDPEPAAVFAVTRRTFTQAVLCEEEWHRLFGDLDGAITCTADRRVAIGQPVTIRVATHAAAEQEQTCVLAVVLTCAAEADVRSGSEVIRGHAAWDGLRQRSHGDADDLAARFCGRAGDRPWRPGVEHRAFGNDPVERFEATRVDGHIPEHVLDGDHGAGDRIAVGAVEGTAAFR